MKKFLLLISSTAAIALIGALLFFYTAFATNDNFGEELNKITFYTSNDVHGGLDSANGLNYHVMAQLKEKGNENNPTYLVDAGDHAGGSPYANYDAGMTIINLMKDASYDFAIPGNHEFDVGTDHFFDDIVPSAGSAEGMPATANRYKYYACNFYHVNNVSDPSLCLDAHKMFSIYNPNTKTTEKIALIGIMTPETMAKTAPGYFQDKDGNWLYGISSNENASDMLNTKVNNAIKEAKDNGAKYCIGVGHLGINTKETPKNKATDVILGVNSDGDEYSLDAFIDGHSHNYATYPEKGSAETDPQNPYKIVGWDDSQIAQYAIPYIQTGTAFAHIGKMDLSIDDAGKLNINTDFVNTYDYIDDEVHYPVTHQTYVDLFNWINYINSELATKVAKSYTYFYDNDVEDSSESATRLTRRRESNLTDLCSDAFYWNANTNYGDCDLAMINGGSIRTHLYEQDNVLTMLSCIGALPYQNEFCIAKLKGSVILDALEFGARGFGVLSSDKQTTVEIAGLMQVSGLTFLVDNSVESSVQISDGIWQGPPTGEYRIKNVQVYNKESEMYEDLDLNKIYTVAGTRYFFQSYGDGFAMFQGCESTNYGTLPSNVLMNYLEAFQKTNANDLPEITSQNSPLNIYSNFKLNYENKYGANRTGINKFDFNTNGGTYIAPQYLFVDGYAYRPLENPIKENYTFDNWYDNETLQTVYEFSTVLNSNKTVYAKWNEVQNPQATDTPHTNDNLLWVYILLLIICVVVTYLIIHLQIKLKYKR